MALNSALKKSEAIRRARRAVAPPTWLHSRQFVVRVPSDIRRVDGAWIEVTAKEYLEAQHIRSCWIARIALALMGIEHVNVSEEEGGTIEARMDKALEWAAHGTDGEQTARLWEVWMGSGRPLVEEQEDTRT